MYMISLAMDLLHPWKNGIYLSEQCFLRFCRASVCGAGARGAASVCRVIGSGGYPASPLHMMAATAHHIVSYVYDLSSYGAIASLEKLVPRRSKRLSIGTVLPPFLPRFRLWGRRTSAAGHNVRLPAEGSRLAITPAGRGSKK
jgi:hypothetical protein